MKTNLFLAILCIFSAALPVSAKSVWLKCGNYQIELDSDRERYSIELSKLYQGSAIFNPSQINFNVLWFSGPYGDGTRYEFAIDRKSLDYTKQVVSRINLPGFSDTGWRAEASKTERGKCMIMKNPPTKGNQI
jgi:hypothetical protein